MNKIYILIVAIGLVIVLNTPSYAVDNTDPCAAYKSPRGKVACEQHYKQVGRMQERKSKQQERAEDRKQRMLKQNMPKTQDSVESVDPVETAVTEEALEEQGVAVDEVKAMTEEQGTADISGDKVEPKAVGKKPTVPLVPPPMTEEDIINQMDRNYQNIN